MKIISLQYEDLSTGWKLDLTEFNPQLTLLVGVSGVGKTQILRALLNLKQISQGASLNGVKWNIKFTTTIGYSCEWSGEFENKGFIPESMTNYFEKSFDLINEKLYCDENLIIERNKEGIFLNGTKTVKLSQKQSVISLLREEEQIHEIYESFKKICFSGNLESYREFLKEELEYRSIESIRNSNDYIITKLYFLYKYHNQLFNDEITNVFISIFPYIEDIKIEAEVIPTYNGNFRYPFHKLKVKLKEKNVTTLIEESNFSFGMWKTLIHIAELYLCADSSIILIDEFENSLGINCIDEVTYQILASERDLQFIITSHHPYIINKIGYQYWKVVTRKGSVVKAVDAEKLGIGKSRLQAFTQLGNLPAFAKGIES